MGSGVALDPMYVQAEFARAGGAEAETGSKKDERRRNRKRGERSEGKADGMDEGRRKYRSRDERAELVSWCGTCWKRSCGERGNIDWTTG